MTPTIVLKNGKPFLVTGSPGGSRIITAVLQVISNVIDLKLPVAQAVAAARIHDQWSPDEACASAGFDAGLIRGLAGLGHNRQGRRAAHLGQLHHGRAGFVGAADPRSRGALAAGY